MGRKRGVQYKAGSFYRTDERSGFAVRAEDTKKEWTSAIVAERFYEPRQPQDFVKGVPDPQNVPDARPENPPIWDGPIYAQLATGVAIGATFWALETTYGFSAGDKVGLMLDSGVLFNTTIDGAPTADGINVVAGAPYTAASGNLVTDYGAEGP